jgi:hypothetical protein
MNENFPKDFEDELRRRLRAVDPPEGFLERLRAALPPEQRPTVVAFNPRAARPARQFGLPAALAASLLGAVFFGMHVANERTLRQEQEGIAASQQLMQALRVTSQKLDLAYEAVNHPPDAGDEENRS